MHSTSSDVSTYTYTHHARTYIHTYMHIYLLQVSVISPVHAICCFLLSLLDLNTAVFGGVEIIKLLITLFCFDK